MSLPHDVGNLIPDHHCHWFIFKNDLCRVEFALSGGMLHAFVACILPRRILGALRPWQDSLQLLGVHVGLYEGTTEMPPC